MRKIIKKLRHFRNRFVRIMRLIFTMPTQRIPKEDVPYVKAACVVISMLAILVAIFGTYLCHMFYIDEITLSPLVFGGKG